MRLSDFLLRPFLLLLPLAVAATVYIYLYPAFQQCAFPEASNSGDSEHGRQAPFRLLTLADPQLEGDTSLPDPDAPIFPSLHAAWDLLEHASEHEQNLVALLASLGAQGASLLSRDLPRLFQAYRKRLDLRGNDLYLAHIYRLMHWWTDPTHVVVLGDLLGSQWIRDDEFARRTARFWGTVFPNGNKVGHEVTEDAPVEVLGEDESWKHRIIAVAGNHDIGYAGDITRERIARFEEAYGSVNWEVHFALDSSENSPKLRLTVLNSMNLDGPAFDNDLRAESLAYLDQHVHQGHLSSDTATILLTHIPLYKNAGVCIDGPFFDYFKPENGGGIKEQNHLSSETSTSILSALVGAEQRDRQALILNGHDHEGCHVYHALAPNDTKSEDGSEDDRDLVWQAYPYHSPEGATKRNPSFVGVREVTVRSMMGDFGGNAGLVSAWWDSGAKEWKFGYTSCEAGVQHIWWAVHVVDLVTLGMGLAGLLVRALEGSAKKNTVDLKKKTV